MKRKVALISEHASPFTVIDTLDREGHHVYVSQVAQHLARLGYLVDVITRKDNRELPETYHWLDNLRLIHVPAGPPTYVREESLFEHMREFSEYLVEFFSRQERPYDLIHANFWRSGWVAAEIKASLGTPFVITFHTPGVLRQSKHNGLMAGQRFETENRVLREADGIIARCPQDRQDLISLYDVDPAYIAQIPERPHEELPPATNRPEAREPDSCVEDEIEWYRRLFTWQDSASMLTDFYENVLAVRRVSIPHAGTVPLFGGVYEPWPPPGLVEHMFDETRGQIDERILAAADLIADCLERGGRILVFGDGAAVSLAQRFAVELLKYFPAAGYADANVLLLTTDGFSMKHLLDEMEAVGRAGDLLMGIAGHGDSAHLVELFRCARIHGIHCLSLSGGDESRPGALSEVSLAIPASNASQIHEVQLMVLHLLCELVRARTPVRSQIAADPSSHVMPATVMQARPVG